MAKLDIEGLRAGARVDIGGKKSPTDFALWKLSPKDVNRDMEWDSPWGRGFPGWHLECSTMAMELLGEQIDIHTGGVDHIPVHHTNEIAQTESITHKPFANIWLHNNHMQINGRKMSKSLGNVYTLDNLIDKGYSPQSFRLLVLTSNYHTQSNFTWKLLNASQSRLKRWQSVADQRWQLSNDSTDVVDIIDESTKGFQRSLDDDLDTPKALSELEKTFNVLEKTRLSKHSSEKFVSLLKLVKSRLGIDLLKSDITVKQKELILARQEAKDKKDFEESDRIRDSLLSQQITLKDTPDGVLWSRR